MSIGADARWVEETLPADDEQQERDDDQAGVVTDRPVQRRIPRRVARQQALMEGRRSKEVEQVHGAAHRGHGSRQGEQQDVKSRAHGLSQR